MKQFIPPPFSVYGGCTNILCAVLLCRVEEGFMDIIRVEGVSKSYGDHPS